MKFTFRSFPSRVTFLSTSACQNLKTSCLWTGSQSSIFFELILPNLMKPVNDWQIIYDKEKAGDLFSWFLAKKLCFTEFTLLSKDFSGMQSLSSCTLSLSSLNHHLLQHHPSFHWNFQHYTDPSKMKFKQYASS